MLKNNTLKNGISRLGLYWSPPRCCFTVQTKNVRTANVGRTESNSNKWNINAGGTESNSNKWNMNMEHGFLLSGSSPHKVFVSVSLLYPS